MVKVTGPNLLLAGQASSGKTSIIRSILGSAAPENPNQARCQHDVGIASIQQRCIKYQNPERTFTIWNSKALEPGDIDSAADKEARTWLG
jgi:GTPase SAR1 family protein